MQTSARPFPHCDLDDPRIDFESVSRDFGVEGQWVRRPNDLAGPRPSPEVARSCSRRDRRHREWRRIETLAVIRVRFLGEEGRAIGGTLRAPYSARFDQGQPSFDVPRSARTLRLFFEAINYLGACALDRDGGAGFIYEAG